MHDIMVADTLRAGLVQLSVLLAITAAIVAAGAKARSTGLIFVRRVPIVPVRTESFAPPRRRSAL
jgi:hypothetical protein